MIRRRLKNYANVIMGQSVNSSSISELSNFHGQLEFHQGNKLFNNGYIDTADIFTSEGKTGKKSDVVLSVRAPVGEVAKLNRKIKLGRGLAALRFKNGYLHNFFYYKIIGERHKLLEQEKGTTFKAITVSDLKNIVFDVTESLKDQTTIANYLDQHTASIDREVELLERRIELTEEYRQALIYETVTKGLNQDVPMKASGVEWIGDIPSHWEVKRLKELFKERKEKNIKNDTFKTDNVLSVLKDVGVVLYSEKGNVGNKMSDDITGYKIVKPGDLVLNKMNVTIGSLGISKYYGALSIVYLVLKGINTINAMYYQYVFRSRKWQRYLKTMSNGIMDIRESVDMTLFNGQLLLAPPLQEQNAIALYLDQETSKLDQKLELLRKKVELLKEYKQSLIYEAVTGKIPTSEM